MSLIVPPFGSVDVIVPASGIVTAFSQGAFQINQQLTNTNVPGVFSVLTSQAAGAAAPYTSAAFASGAVVRIEASGGKEVAYDVGASPGSKLGRVPTAQGIVAQAVNTSATLTPAQIAAGLVTSTTAAAVSATLPTGAVMDAGGSWAIGEAVIWRLSNSGPNTLTVLAGATHTIVGTAAVLTLVTTTFMTLKTAAATYITYRC
jgi:hypothetical protein